MENKNHYYKEELKKEIVKVINGLDPREALKNHSFGECPSCHEENTFAYYPEFKYGICNECSYEKGFEYYTTVMGNRLEDFEEIQSKIQEVLNSWK